MWRSTRRSISRRASRSRTPSASSTRSPKPAASARASSASPRRSPPRWTWPRAPTSATASCPGLATGLKDLDAKMGGLQSSDLIIVAGRPGMGKTALATNIAYNIAKAHRGETRRTAIATVDGGIVGFFSLEMSAEQLATRIIAERNGHSIESYPARRHHRGRFRDHQGCLGRIADPALLRRRDRRPFRSPSYAPAPGA